MSLRQALKLSMMEQKKETAMTVDSTAQEPATASAVKLATKRRRSSSGASDKSQEDGTTSTNRTTKKAATAAARKKGAATSAAGTAAAIKTKPNNRAASSNASEDSPSSSPSLDTDAGVVANGSRKKKKTSSATSDEMDIDSTTASTSNGAKISFDVVAAARAAVQSLGINEPGKTPAKHTSAHASNDSEATDATVTANCIIADNNCAHPPPLPPADTASATGTDNSAAARSSAAADDTRSGGNDAGGGLLQSIFDEFGLLTLSSAMRSSSTLRNADTRLYDRHRWLAELSPLANGHARGGNNARAVLNTCVSAAMNMFFSSSAMDAKKNPKAAAQSLLQHSKETLVGLLKQTQQVESNSNTVEQNRLKAFGLVAMWAGYLATEISVVAPIDQLDRRYTEGILTQVRQLLLFKQEQEMAASSITLSHEHIRKDLTSSPDYTVASASSGVSDDLRKGWRRVSSGVRSWLQVDQLWANNKNNKNNSGSGMNGIDQVGLSRLSVLERLLLASSFLQGVCASTNNALSISKSHSELLSLPPPRPRVESNGHHTDNKTDSHHGHHHHHHHHHRTRDNGTTSTASASLLRGTGSASNRHASGASAENNQSTTSKGAQSRTQNDRLLSGDDIGGGVLNSATRSRISQLMGKCFSVNLPTGGKTDRFGEFCKFYYGYDDVCLRDDRGRVQVESKIPMLPKEEGYRHHSLTWWGVQEVPDSLVGTVKGVRDDNDDEAGWSSEDPDTAPPVSRRKSNVGTTAVEQASGTGAHGAGGAGVTGGASTTGTARLGSQSKRR